MLSITYTTAFKKSYKRVLKQGKSATKIDNILYHLAHQIPLDKKFRDHKLTGDCIGKRECQIEPDWLLIYEVNEEELILHATGSHAELFGK